jgi:hypothetical protein
MQQRNTLTLKTDRNSLLSSHFLSLARVFNAAASRLPERASAFVARAAGVLAIGQISSLSSFPDEEKGITQRAEWAFSSSLLVRTDC